MPLSLTDMFMIYNEIKNSEDLNVVTIENVDAIIKKHGHRESLNKTFSALLVQGESLLEAIADNLNSTNFLGLDPLDLARAGQQVQMEMAVADHYLKIL